MKLHTRLSLTAAGLLLALNANAESYRVMVTIENLAPANSTFQTPHWVGFHDGSFDIYDGGTPASNLPISGSVAVERLAEDGNNDVITEDFMTLQPDGVQASIPGPNGALGPGEIATQSFTIDSHSYSHRYFSYGSMLLPSNDFWYANGNPLAHPVFDDKGNFIAEDFFVTNVDILDAGTEVNDEIPENTAFFGQQVPNSGVDENGVIVDAIDADGNAAFGFMPAGSGGILDDPRFINADFTKPGYPLVRISFKAVPAIVDDRDYASKLSGDAEVPPASTDAKGLAKYHFNAAKGKFGFSALARLKRDDVVAAHLHLGAEGENGPVVAALFDETNRDTVLREQHRDRPPLHVVSLYGILEGGTLEGPLAGKSIDALVEAIENGKIYINVHTKQFPDGEIRGQLESGY